jgi:hypothetical protein
MEAIEIAMVTGSMPDKGRIIQTMLDVKLADISETKRGNI